MFEIPHNTEARLASVTNRVERHGDEEKPAVSLGLELTVANTLLDCIDPSIREALYKAIEGQETLPGVETSTPVLRCNAFDRHVLTTAHEGWTLAVDDSIDESDPMVFGGCKVDKMSVEAKQGGSVVLRFRVGTSDVDAESLGKLAMHNGQAIWITLTAPRPGLDAKQPSPEPLTADNLFSRTVLGPPDPEESDSEGGEPDVRADGDRPFPDPGANPATPPLADVVGTAGRRTARGRAATKAALDAGRPA